MSRMNVKLVSESDFGSMRRGVKIEPKKLYDMSLDIIHPRWTKHKSRLDEIEFIYKPAHVASGEFEVNLVDEKVKTTMIINLARIRTYRDLVYTIYHEWRHAYQLQKFGFKSFCQMSARLEENYTGSLIERDADKYAFWLEDKLTYKNFMINKNCPYSIFIERKKFAR